ncbi:MAG: hypothetical protein K8R36_08865 [Planctomycetales bacterium]|nr:hypothetical protein [Planctomycetales bacterium]
MRANISLLIVLAILACSLPPANADFPKKVKTKGKITAIAPGKIMLRDGTNNSRTFNIQPDREVGITVQGKLTLADLKPGMLVRVEGPLKMNTLEGEVAKVTVYSANDGYEAGIVQQSKEEPAIVTANIKLVKDNTLTLLAGKKKITAKLAKELAIEVDSKDYALAPTGSLIEAEGYETKDGSVNAKKITITVGKVEKKESKPQDAKTAKSEKKAKAEEKE